MSYISNLFHRHIPAVSVVTTLLGFALFFCLSKLVFLAANSTIYPDLSLGLAFKIMGHGLSMDFCIAAYLTAIPALIFCAWPFVAKKKALYRSISTYIALASILASLAVVLDAILYPYWQFKLDATPLFYFFTSPKAALASATWWQYIAAPLAWLALAAVCYAILYATTLRWLRKNANTPPLRNLPYKTKWSRFATTFVFTALLFLPIRGGVTVSTMNPSRAYFSPEPRLNHAAVNPLFSLFYSVTHQNDFGKRYRFFEPEEAQRLFASIYSKNTENNENNENNENPLLSSPRPDIYIILLESFSSHLFPSLGGEPVALKLDSIASSGLLFSNIYASGIRTDRGIPAVLSAYPSLTDNSIMKYVEKTDRLPSIPRSLVANGYDAEYYYGGDANFTNMNAFLASAGFGKIISDKDFPLSQKLSKWGAHDHVVFEKALSSLKPYNPEKPYLRVIQTSSSHEPFEVPYDDKGRFDDPRASAFAYADSCAADFVNDLAKLPSWQNSLVVLVPDHYGAYPDLSHTLDRHKVPVIMTGGALAVKGVNKVPGSQTDIAATLLAALGIDTADFVFSRPLLDNSIGHAAFFAEPSRIGLATESDSLVYNLDTGTIEQGREETLPLAKAYLQTIYTDFSKR